MFWESFPSFNSISILSVSMFSNGVTNKAKNNDDETEFVSFMQTSSYELQTTSYFVLCVYLPKYTEILGVLYNSRSKNMKSVKLFPVIRLIVMDIPVRMLFF